MITTSSNAQSAALQPLPNALQHKIEILFTDVDDTLTWQGKLPVETFVALDKLRKKGITVIPVTGASAGWCDCMIRTWPIDYVIGENGSFWMARDKNGKVSYNYSVQEQQRQQNLATLHTLAAEVKKRFPSIDYTPDQAFRFTDIAFDIGQETKVDPQQALAALQWLQQQGINAKLSSIHINAWLGDYSKAATALRWLADQGKSTTEHCAFIGDSPNDEAMFEHFDCSIGVANIAKFVDNMQYHPRYITQSNGGFGFVELADIL
ncbi:MAG: HAD family hydrolase [Oceanospirillaceae bacterium]